MGIEKKTWKGSCGLFFFTCLLALNSSLCPAWAEKENYRGATVFFDSFDKEDLQKWEPVSGKWMIKDGSYQVEAEGGDALMLSKDRFGSDYIIELKNKWFEGKSRKTAVVVRAVDKDNYFAVNFSGTTLRYMEVADGKTKTDISDQVYDVYDGKWHSWKILVQKNRCILYLDDEYISELDDIPIYKQGDYKIGFWCVSATKCAVDDVRVSLLTASLPPKPEVDYSCLRDVGSDKQLFIDDKLIEKSDGIKLIVNRPLVTGERCIVADKPWEIFGIGGYVSVMEDEGIYKVWYSTPADGEKMWLCYATSQDGIHWEKPQLNIVPGKEKSNIIYPDKSNPLRRFFAGSVFKDTNPKCPSQERYKLISCDQETWVFASPDGLHFKPLYDHPSFRASDTANICFFDERIGKYVAYIRDWAKWRKVGRCEFDDLSNFGREKIVFSYDDKDQEKLDRSRFDQMDFYNSSAIKYPYAANAYFMFPSAYYHFLPSVSQAHDKTNDGVLDIQFAASRDGIHWDRIDREPFIPRGGKGSGTEGSLYMAAGFFQRDDKLYLYYSGSACTHGAYTPKETKSSGVIIRAVLRLDGFVSVDTADKGGTLTTVPIIFAGKYLKLNVAGEARVALLDEAGQPVAGFSLDDCDVINGDYIAKTVAWRGKSDLAKFTGRQVKLQFKMKNAKLYAFQFGH